jgi:hypothetical protein
MGGSIQLNPKPFLATHPICQVNQILWKRGQQRNIKRKGRKLIAFIFFTARERRIEKAGT